MHRTFLTALLFLIAVARPSAQTLRFAGKVFELSNVKASVVKLGGKKALKVERDLAQLPFDAQRLEATVDEPTFVRLKGFDFENGTIEVKVLSRIQNPSPFAFAQGFIGLAFRINDDHSAFESIYLRPRVGRSEDQLARNHTVQYFAYPDYKFERLRQPAFKGRYETYADVGLDEWITLRLEIRDKKAELYINNQRYPSFIVNELLSSSKSGGIGLWVDIGTEGYFRDLQVVRR